MRIFCLWAVSTAIVACTVPNPAWQLTESTGAGATDGASGSTGAVATAGDGSSTTAVTTGGTLPGTSEPATTEPATSGPVTSTSMTTEAESTTGVMACAFAESPDLELTYTTAEPTGCDPSILRQAHVEVLKQLAPNQWKFNVCANDDPACKKENATCADLGDHLILTFDGPPELVPTFVPGECHDLHALPRGVADDDPLSCKLSLLRIAHTRFTPSAVHYVGATAVPGTDGLPAKVDWLTLLGFELVSMIDTPCLDEMNCQPPVGTYNFVVHWGMAAKEYVVGEGESFTEEFQTTNPNQQPLTIKGTFTPLRARIEPGACGSGRQFKWVWLAELPNG